MSARIRDSTLPAATVTTGTDAATTPESGMPRAMMEMDTVIEIE